MTNVVLLNRLPPLIRGLVILFALPVGSFVLRVFFALLAALGPLLWKPRCLGWLFAEQDSAHHLPAKQGRNYLGLKEGSPCLVIDQLPLQIALHTLQKLESQDSMATGR